MNGSGKNLKFSLLLVLFFSSQVIANPVTYTLQGTAAGSIDAKSFAGESYVFTLVGDTNNLVTICVVDGCEYENSGMVTFQVGGVSTQLGLGRLSCGSVDVGPGCRLDLIGSAPPYPLLWQSGCANTAFTESVSYICNSIFQYASNYPVTDYIFSSSLGQVDMILNPSGQVTVQVDDPIPAPGLTLLGVVLLISMFLGLAHFKLWCEEREF